MPNDSDENSLIKITDIFGVAKPGARIVSAIERGIGKLLSPIQKRREARADISNFEGWNEALKRAGLTATATELTIQDRTTVRVIAENVRQQQNREFIALEAATEYQAINARGGREDTDQGIPPEWLDRFWRLAQEITDSDMQAVWGRVLARQALEPTKYSARCLEALSLLSKQEAQKLEKLSRFVLSATAGNMPFHFFLSKPYRLKSDVPSEDNSKKIEKIIGDPYRSIFGPAGLYTDSGSGWAQPIHIDVAEGNAFMSIAKKPFVIRYPNSTTCLDYIGVGLGITPLGAEIFSLIEAEPDPQYVQALTSAFLPYGLKLERNDG